MQNNMKTFTIKIFAIGFLGITALSIQSCSEDDTNSNGLKCTTYLNGNVYSEKTVTDCSLCFAPQGFTTSCN